MYELELESRLIKCVLFVSFMGWYKWLWHYIWASRIKSVRKSNLSVAANQHTMKGGIFFFFSVIVSMCNVDTKICLIFFLKKYKIFSKIYTQSFLKEYIFLLLFIHEKRNALFLVSKQSSFFIDYFDLWLHSVWSIFYFLFFLSEFR